MGKVTILKEFAHGNVQATAVEIVKQKAADNKPVFLYCHYFYYH